MSGHTPEPWDDGTHSWGSSVDGETVLCVPEDDYVRAVAAFNNTFAAGINPDAVPLMLEALRAVSRASHLHGSYWMEAIFDASQVCVAALAKATEVKP